MNDYLIMQVCLVMEAIGFFKGLASKENGESVTELSKKLRVDETLLRKCVEFLWLCTDILDKENDFVALKKSGTGNIAWTLWMMCAYKPVVDNMTGLLRKEKLYNRDVKRNSHYLQKASFALTESAIKKITDGLREKGPKILIDLGCGWADSLIMHCQNSAEHFGVGIDIDAETVREAVRRVENLGLRNKIQVLRADIIDIDRWKNYVPRDEEIAFLASGILHEFLGKSEEHLIDFLKSVRKAFPLAHFFIIEYDMPSSKIIKEEPASANNLFATSYALLHPFTNQGDPQPKEVWERLLSAAGWKIMKINGEISRLIFHCVSNKNVE